MKILKYFFLILLMAFSCAFADNDIQVDVETAAQKLERAPAAFYGSLVNSNVYSKDLLKFNDFQKIYPQAYKAFMEWSEFKMARMQRDLADAPELVRKTFELRSSAKTSGFYLIHNIVRVDKVYDKTSKSWRNPKSDEVKKVFISFAYVGPDIFRDSTSWQLTQRVISVPVSDVNERPVKRVFFVDGTSEPCAFLDQAHLEKLRFFAYRMSYNVEPNYAIEVRKHMETLVSSGDFAAAAQIADSADLSPRSKILLKLLNRDYEFIANKDSVSLYRVTENSYPYEDRLDGLLNDQAAFLYFKGSSCNTLPDIPDVGRDSLCLTVKKIALKQIPKMLIAGKSAFSFALGSDVGFPFLAGKFPDYKSYFYFDVVLDFCLYDVVFGFEFNGRALDGKCDSCGIFDYGIQSVLGYKWLTTNYFESAVFGNLGGAFYVVPRHEDKKRINKQEPYFRYGLGAYVDLLVPNIVGKPMPKGDPLVGRLAFRLKAGFHNMKASKYGDSDGISPYIAIGFLLRGDVVKLGMSDIPSRTVFAKLDNQY